MLQILLSIQKVKPAGFFCMKKVTISVFLTSFRVKHITIEIQKIIDKDFVLSSNYRI